MPFSCSADSNSPKSIAAHSDRRAAGAALRASRQRRLQDLQQPRLPARVHCLPLLHVSNASGT